MKSKLIAAEFLMIGSGNIALQHIDAIISYKKNSKVHLLKRSSAVNNIRVQNACETVSSDIHNFIPLTTKSVAIITSPASKHIDDAIILAKKGFHLLIEKPLMISRKGYQKLINITNKKLLCTHVAYNLRFNNLIINLKKIINSNIHGRILNVDISITSNFKKWRPNKNYYETVSAQKKFGGGVINELSHDFDYMLYLFGKPIAVTSELSYSRDKRIDVETKSINSFRYKDFLINLYQDMCSDKEERKCIVDFEKAKIVLDFNKNKICVIKDQKKKYIIKKDAMASTYENQFDYFMKCVKSKSKSSMSISDNKLLFKTLSSVKLSHKNSKEIRI